MLFVWSTKLAVDIATKANTSVSLSTAFALLACVIVLQIVLGIASRWVKATLGVKSLNKMHSSFFNLLLNSDWRKLRSFHTGDLTNRLQRDASEVTNFLTESLPTLVTTLIKFTAAFAFLYVMDSTLELLIVVILPVFILLGRLYVNKMRAITHNVRTTESGIQSLMQESLQHTPVIKTLQQVPYVVDKLLKLQKRLRGEIIQKTKYSTFTSTLLNVGFASGYFLTFAWGTYSLSQGNITYGTLIAFVQLVSQIQDPVRTLTRFIPIFISVGTSCDRLREIASLPTEPQPINDLLNDKVGIRIKNLSFAYDENSRKIFNDYSLTLNPGSRIAIMGETGTGKTTLVNLLCGMYDPNEGAVLLNDVDIRQFNRQEYYQLFCAVFQEYSIMDATVEENVTLSCGNVDEAKLSRCLEHAGLTEKIAAMPRGIHTHLGREVHLDGIMLSGGLTQRLLLARALYKDAPILVLDEPTSALDPLAEHDIYTKYNKMTKGKTSLFISHRLASTRFCDRIILLGQGQILEEGTHEELLALNEQYAELFQIQSRYYQEGGQDHE